MMKKNFKNILGKIFVSLLVLSLIIVIARYELKKSWATDAATEDSSLKSDDISSEITANEQMRGFDFQSPLFRGSGLARAIPNQAFGVGEKLVYSVGYGMIKAGEASMEIKEITKIGENKCFHILSSAKSSKFFSVFFKVNDKIESFVDVYGLYPLRFEKHLMEGKYRADAYVEFDQKRKLAISGKDTIPIPVYVQDALSVLYYARTQKLEVGKSISVENYADKKNYLLEIKVYRKETVKVPAGKFDCIVVEPFLKGSTVFKHEGKLLVWLTDDQKKMPVLMKSKASFLGSINVSLKEYCLGEVGKY